MVESLVMKKVNGSDTAQPKGYRHHPKGKIVKKKKKRKRNKHHREDGMRLLVH